MKEFHHISQADCAEVVEGPTPAALPVVRYKTANIDGVEVFYREAGPVGAPVLLLLHGFPTSSHMFRNLIPVLAKRYHVIAPDYPGFGQSGVPDRSAFAYTFANLATIVDKLTVLLGAMKYSMYLMDYGAPIGYRLALAHPDRIQALVIQNGNAYDEGIAGAFWDPFKAYWADGSQASREALARFVTLETTRLHYMDGMSDIARVSPDSWMIDQALLDRPGIREIHLDLFHDYGSNVALYPEFQAFFRRCKPPALILWGKNDPIFPEAGAHPYLRDLPRAELHVLETGHYALEDKFNAMVPLIGDFLERNSWGRYRS
ncbi:alpha/beta hydrolase [Pseudoduganella sp. SL102]|uniref:alpha/beta fold hydrolase n=1 Tax=Pseudoduganella sp. SL102 TaxID=2995154 RepID=UPI00248CB03F|nr:alpha/beta hydrolase [Pseudoduganella sp. SL102]WBS04239.1 alpha/beta hydrolase [Pseudoduganella sp. SL102]